jgi:hypothetical protein
MRRTGLLMVLALVAAPACARKPPPPTSSQDAKVVGDEGARQTNKGDLEKAMNSAAHAGGAP